MHWRFGGRGQRWQLTGVHVLTQAGVREAAADWDEAVRAALPFMPNSIVGLHFYGILGFLQQYSWLWSSSLLSPQAVSRQPIAVLSSGLFSKPHIPHHIGTPHLPPSTSGDACLRLRYAGLRTARLWTSHSVPPATDRLRHSPPGPKPLLLSELISSQ